MGWGGRQASLIRQTGAEDKEEEEEVDDGGAGLRRPGSHATLRWPNVRYASVASSPPTAD